MLFCRRVSGQIWMSPVVRGQQWWQVWKLRSTFAQRRMNEEQNKVHFTQGNYDPLCGANLGRCVALGW